MWLLQVTDVDSDQNVIVVLPTPSIPLGDLLLFLWLLSGLRPGTLVPLRRD